MQQNQADKTLATGFSNDGNIIDLEKRLFHEKEEQTKKHHQAGFEEIIKFKNSFDSQSNSCKGLFKVYPNQPQTPQQQLALPQTNEPIQQNRTNTPTSNFQQFTENLTRIFKNPGTSNDQNQNVVTQNCPMCSHNINVPCSSGSLNNSEKFIKNYNYDQNTHCCITEDGRQGILKPILRNNIFRPDCEKIDMNKRNVTFDSSRLSNESKHLFPNLAAHCNTHPDQMDCSPTYCNQNNQPFSHINQGSPFGNKPNINPENDPFKYNYLNLHSHRIPEEKPQVNCVNNHSGPPPNGYFPGGFTNPNFENQNFKFENSYPQSSANSKMNEFCTSGQQPFQNFVQDKLSPSSTISSYNQFLNYGEKLPDFDSNQTNDKFNFQPRTQERETVIFKKDGFNFQNTNCPQIFSSQPCFAIPADAAYFYSDKLELYVNAKLLIPERMKLNILPEKIELYGCTEQTCNNTTSLIEIFRVYDLPAKIIPEQSNCLLSPDGILYLTSRWENPFR